VLATHDVVTRAASGAEESWWHEATINALSTNGHRPLRGAGESHALPADAVHSVMNRWDVSNGIIHVYAGNFLALERTIWDPVTSQRTPAGLKEMTAPLGITSPVDDSGP
jgi:predicted metal-dependent enzyme (double-stranded beta helix superfamily)